MSVLTILGVVGIGVLAGVLSGMFGVGGAAITTPGIRAMGASAPTALGTTIPAIIPGAVTGSIRYARAGLVDWRLGLGAGASGAVFAALGAWSTKWIDAHVLMVVTACLLAFSGVRMLRDPTSEPAEPEGDANDASGPLPVSGGVGLATRAPARVRIGLPAILASGAAAGTLAGLLGVGGGILMVPAFVTVLRVPVKTAVASSLVAVGILALPALVVHAALGHIDWVWAVLLMLGTVPGASIGSRITIGARAGTVRRMFGGFLAVVAVVYGVSELLAI
ncbi:MAG: sulfite exporter TauE/SafE family protein [Acidimicrobiia bacterium]|nr:sulfite exporter TauE/SafE family protein [Acidimicrobiia bacterium]